MTEPVIPAKVSEPTFQHKTLFTGRTYDSLKWLALIVLPAIGALYFGLAGVWGLPNADKIVGTITVLDTFLGTLLGISTYQYNREPTSFDGVLKVTNNDDNESYTMSFYASKEDLPNRDKIVFKVLHDGENF